MRKNIVLGILIVGGLVYFFKQKKEGEKEQAQTKEQEKKKEGVQAKYDKGWELHKTLVDGNVWYKKETIDRVSSLADVLGNDMKGGSMGHWRKLAYYEKAAELNRYETWYFGHCLTKILKVTHAQIGKRVSSEHFENNPPLYSNKKETMSRMHNAAVKMLDNLHRAGFNVPNWEK